MTLRDLTEKQVKQLQKRGEKERVEYERLYLKHPMTAQEVALWIRAFSNGLKAGLEFAPPFNTVNDNDAPQS